MTIDWYRLARPQVDGYDTALILEAAAKEYEYVKQEATPPSWVGIQLAEGIPSPSPALVPAPFDHPTLALGEQYLAAWPECLAQVQALTQTLYVFDAPIHAGGRGCYCGTAPRLPGRQDREDGAPFGTVFSTVFDPVGFVEGVVHEMAHWKLHALGIHFERWDDRLLVNEVQEVYESSIRKDKLRPMGAVLHAHWVCVHVLAVQLIALACRNDRESDLQVIRTSVDRVREGQATIASARWTEAGKVFWRGIEDWTAELLVQADALLGVVA